MQKILRHCHKSPGSSNRSIDIRRHMCTSGNVQFVARTPKVLKSMENSCLRKGSYVKVIISLQKH